MYSSIQPEVTEPYSTAMYDITWGKLTKSTLRQYYIDQFESQDCYKVTFTFNRKLWRKARAFKFAYSQLQKILDSADVEKAIFFMETHDSGFPHVHGIVKWCKGYESPDWLRNRLVQVYGQTKVFKYDPEGFREKLEKEKKDAEYQTWYDYFTKDYEKMKEFRHSIKIQFDILQVYERNKDDFGEYRYKESNY